MGDFGLIASRLQLTNKSLKDYDAALRYFRLKPTNVSESQIEQYFQKLDSVLKQVVNSTTEKLSSSTIVDSRDIVTILRQHHRKDWEEFKTKLKTISTKIEIRNKSFDKTDFMILNDVADAIDTTCSKLFKRMERFP